MSAVCPANCNHWATRLSVHSPQLRESTDLHLGSLLTWKLFQGSQVSNWLTSVISDLFWIAVFCHLIECLVKKQQLEPDIEQLTGSKLGKEYIKALYCHPAYLTYMQSTSCKMPGWMKLKLESRLPGEISITSDMQLIPPLWQKTKRN